MNGKTTSPRDFRDYVKLWVIGFAMGVANVIPGVSGGTIAFIYGIYAQLIQSLKSCDRRCLQMVLTGRFAEAWAYISGKFLGTLFFGVLVAIFSLAKLMSWLFQHYPVFVNAFFFGLILATVPIISKNIRQVNARAVLLIILATVATYYFVGLVPLQTPDALWFVFLAGAISICAMILPGVSGAYVLVLLGKYQYIINAVSERNLVVLAAVGVGCVFGILTFVRLLSWLFHRYYDITVAVLTGLVVGSLRKIWPWKQVLSSITTHSGKVIPLKEINFIPDRFDQEVLWALVFCVVGFLLALLLSRFEEPVTPEAKPS